MIRSAFMTPFLMLRYFWL